MQGQLLHKQVRKNLESLAFNATVTHCLDRCTGFQAVPALVISLSLFRMETKNNCQSIISIGTIILLLGCTVKPVNQDT